MLITKRWEHSCHLEETFLKIAHLNQRWMAQGAWKQDTEHYQKWFSNK